MTQGPKSVALPAGSTVEVWGGIECTVNRVGDRYVDQLELCGHATRLDDLERLADLGIKALRYPVLWERVARTGLADASWSDTDRALNKLRELGIAPIVGLLHHGSGPRGTSLLDCELPGKLATFAAAVAERYPWVESFTPINEPLTTARFSCLYGHWYPHARDDRSFVRAVINQCRAIRASMTAIRAMNPHARLVQTEDLGRTYSTPALGYQATFDNNRRWLTFDLLGGRIDEWHPLWWYMLESGAERSELESFLEQPCVPDMLGINHYLTSERFLDDRVDLYPPEAIGGNGRHEYADVEAVRVLEDGIAGHADLLREAWQRYGLPIALTEVHLGCTREHQLRWLDEAWKAANILRDEGVDVRAITAWSMLGAFGWSSLLTRDCDDYEPGAFDVRSDPPRPTALAAMVRSLATGGGFKHPVLQGHGWWHDESRLTYPSYGTSVASARPDILQNVEAVAPPILITGCRGTLGYAFQRLARERGLTVRAVSRSEMDVACRESVRAQLSAIRPWAVINAAGYVRVDDAETDRESCRRTNTDGAIVLAEECAELGIPVVSFSSDLVFDGSSRIPYTEFDAVNPLNAYGASKAAAELRLAELTNTLTIRTSAFFGPWDSHNFLHLALRALRSGTPFHAADDLWVSPTYVPDLVHNCLDLLIDGERGIWHLANAGAITWAELARNAARKAALDATLIHAVPAASLGLRAKRPAYSVLTSARGALMPSLDDAIARYVAAPLPASRLPLPALTANA
jgi:dTDP-4-dehydrorhamnose reductase